MLFGIRGGTENHKLRWLDIELRSDENGRDLEFNDRETKTKTGENSTHLRAFWPKQFTNPDDPSNCPVTAFKIFRDRRPPATKTPESPLYFAANHKRAPDSKTSWRKFPPFHNRKRRLRLNFTLSDLITHVGKIAQSEIVLV